MENDVLCVFYLCAPSGYLCRSAAHIYKLTTSFFLCVLLFLSSLFCLMGFKTMESANLSRAWLAERLASVSVIVVIKL